MSAGAWDWTTDIATDAQRPLTDYLAMEYPCSLHRRLAEAAERDGVSLNRYVLMLLAQGCATDRAENAVGRAAVDERPREPITA